MDPNAVHKLNRELHKLLDYMRSMIGALIVDKNGILITSQLPREIEERELGAIALSMHNSLETAIESLDQEEVAHISVELDDLQIILMRNEEILLASVLKYSADLGMVLIEMEQLLKTSQTFL
jgi:predicted regulator of Ras-like GTPase activity (Roadblock/LC7/MglB family)